MLHTKTVIPETESEIHRLMSMSWLSDFRLVGGTALSLMKGHRISDDIDLFVDEYFDSEEMMMNLSELYEDKILNQSVLPFGVTLYVQPHEHSPAIKIDVMAFDNDPFLDDAQEIDGVRLCTLKDLMAMKLKAVSHRKTKKDFIDLNLLFDSFDFATAVSLYKERFIYDDEADEKFFLDHLKNIDEADHDEMPKMFMDLEWNDVKKSIHKIVKNYEEKG